MELLVVVAIVALLVSLLIPSLSRARDQARSAVCGTRLREAVRGASVALLSVQRDRLSTNFGWATTSLRISGTQAEVFTCPADTNPVPTPALYMRMYDGSRYQGETSADGPYNYMGRVGATSTYRVNMQDSVDEDYFGRDGGGGSYDANGNFSGDIDVELEWSASRGQNAATVRTRTVESAWTLILCNYRGRTIGNAQNRPVFGAPLMWGSYGLNVSAGLRDVKGAPVLVTEYSKWGIFPELLQSQKTSRAYPPDNLRQKLRFRHGGRSNRGDLRDPRDPSYLPRQRINVGFLDTHVERLGPERITDNRWTGWYGKRPSGAPSF